MGSPTAKMASSLRLFTRNGRESTFSTTLVEDSYTRPLRALVDDGYLTMEYTGTRRIYTLTQRGRDFLEGKKMRKKKQAEPTPTAASAPLQAPPTNGHAQQQTQRSKPGRKPKASSPPPSQASAPPPSPVLLDPPPVAPTGRKPRAQPKPILTLTAARRTEGPLSPLEVIRLMREVRDFAEAHEGVDALLEMIQRVEEIGERFGGLDYVRESLIAIKEFREEKR